MHPISPSARDSKKERVQPFPLSPWIFQKHLSLYTEKFQEFTMKKNCGEKYDHEIFSKVKGREGNRLAQKSHELISHKSIGEVKYHLYH